MVDVAILFYEEARATGLFNEDGTPKLTPAEIERWGSVDKALKAKRKALDARRPDKLVPWYLKRHQDMAKAYLKAKANRTGGAIAGPVLIVNIHGQTEAGVDGAIDADYEEVEIDNDD